MGNDHFTDHRHHECQKQLPTQRSLRLNADKQEVRVVLPDVEDLPDLLAVVVCGQYPVQCDPSRRDDDEHPLRLHRAMDVASSHGVFVGPLGQLFVVSPISFEENLCFRLSRTGIFIPSGIVFTSSAISYGSSDAISLLSGSR